MHKDIVYQIPHGISIPSAVHSRRMPYGIGSIVSVLKEKCLKRSIIISLNGIFHFQKRFWSIAYCLSSVVQFKMVNRNTFITYSWLNSLNRPTKCGQFTFTIRLLLYLISNNGSRICSVSCFSFVPCSRLLFIDKPCKFKLQKSITWN